MRKKGRIILAIVLFATAGLIAYFTMGREDVPPADDDSRTAWKCAACGFRIDLTPAEFTEAMGKAENSIPFYCPKCSERQLFQIAVCPVCSTEYFGPEVPGNSGKCPVCSPPDISDSPQEPADDKMPDVTQY